MATSPKKYSRSPAVIQSLLDDRVELFQSPVAVHLVVANVKVDHFPAAIDHDEQWKFGTGDTRITEFLDRFAAIDQQWIAQVHERV